MKPASSSAPFATSQFLTVIGSAKTLSGDTTADRSVTGLSTPFSIGFDNLTHTYTLQNNERTAVFGPTSFASEKSRPDYYPRVEYDVTGSSGSDYLVIFKQCNCTPNILTTHSSYGAWQHNQPKGADTVVRLDYFIYGTPTPAAAIPHTGTVVYRWYGTGNYAKDDELAFDESYTTVTVNFLTGEVSFDMVLTGSDLLGASHGGLIGFNFTGFISGNTIDGPLSFDSTLWGGTLHLSFYGPDAQDIGIVYSAAATVGTTFNGAGVGTSP